MNNKETVYNFNLDPNFTTINFKESDKEYWTQALKWVSEEFN
jgi:hypothetical protein